MKKFDKAQVGDKVYSLLHGSGVITEVSSPSRLITIDFSGAAGSKKYYLDGRYQANDSEPTLYWNRPLTPDDPEPKRIITKSVILYCNLYKSSNNEVYPSIPYETKEVAKRAWQASEKNVCVLVKEQEVIFVYEEEE